MFTKLLGLYNYSVFEEVILENGLYIHFGPQKGIMELRKRRLSLFAPAKEFRPSLKTLPGY